MPDFQVTELRVGRVGEVPHAGSTVRTAIGKARAAGPLELHELGFAGDAVADTKNHGGPDKAVCVYPAVRYPAWQERLGVALRRPAFGENLLVDGVDEATVHVGDVFEVGSAVVQVAQPRVPCYIPAAYTGEGRLTVDLRATGWTGWYLRVLEPGRVGEGDTGVLRSRVPDAWSVARLNAVRYADRPDRGALLDAAASPALTEGWRAALRKRAAGGIDDD
jgi:MOSC domain-containing protein YiiM